jgi:prephenate dehydrogenase
MEIRTVGIVGYGAFGALANTLIQRFAPGIKVLVYTKGKKPDGRTFFPLKKVSASDTVLLTVPISAFEETLKSVLRFARKDTLIVDVSTVKVHTVGLLKKLAKGRRYIATHPVWGPESYEKRSGDVTGFRIIVSTHTLSKGEYEIAKQNFSSLGFDVVEVNAGAHDKHLAETLFLTHFIGQVVARAGFVRTQVDTVSFGYLMDAVESVKNDEALFRDVFRFNPYCREVLARVALARGEVQTMLENDARGKGSLRIGISGAKGSFSEEAARTYAKRHRIKAFELAYLISVENVLAALSKGEVDLGIFPMQNSTGGIVTEAVVPMSKYDFKIRKVFDIDIKQNLMVRKGVSAKGVKTIISHEQALKQCKTYLKREWSKATLKPYEDTAKAAEDLAKGKLSKTAAVIASRTAAQVYKLKILAGGIQDLKTNFTTFIAASR